MENRIDITREQRQKERFVSKAAGTAAKYLRRMEELSGAPESMAPFFQVLREIYVDGKDVRRERGVKTVGTYCVMAPQELIYAAGAMPVKLCSGSYTALYGRVVGDLIQCLLTFYREQWSFSCDGDTFKQQNIHCHLEAVGFRFDFRDFNLGKSRRTKHCKDGHEE